MSSTMSTARWQHPCKSRWEFWLQPYCDGVARTRYVTRYGFLGHQRPAAVARNDAGRRGWTLAAWHRDTRA